MLNAQLSLEAVRRVASTLNSQLIRQHIENIDLERHQQELKVRCRLTQVLEASFQAQSHFEQVLSHSCFESELRAAVFERINTVTKYLIQLK